MDWNAPGRRTVYLARVFVALALLALGGSWITQLTGGTILGMSQQHFFSDATVLALLGIAFFIDAYWHSQKIQRQVKRRARGARASIVRHAAGCITSWPLRLTTRTGHGALRMTCSATLPSSR